MRVAHYTDRYTESVTPRISGRSTSPTDGRTRRTDVDRWLSSRDNPRFRNARAHIRKFPLEPEPTDLSATRARADKEAAK